MILNGMELRHASEAYSVFWDLISAQYASPNVAAAKIEQYFCHSKSIKGPGRTVVLLLDEVDYLLSKDQAVLYNFFDWPIRAMETRSKNRLIVVGVSNTLNLPERLHPRTQSRIGELRCFFKAYSYEQIANILHAKMQEAAPNHQIFDHDAVVFASKKTAAQSGDLRRAFHICREAAENVLMEVQDSAGDKRKPIVQIKDILKVSRQSFHSARSKALACCSHFEVLLVVALASLMKGTGREQGGFDIEEVIMKMEAMASSTGDNRYMPAPGLAETLTIICRLSQAGLVTLYMSNDTSITYSQSLVGSGGAWPFVNLTLDDVTIYTALKTTQHSQLANRYIMQL
jgi:origin recognition complex subunit 1